MLFRSMACTIAIEEVIGEHYAKQVEVLDDDHKELKSKLMKFRDEELEHLETGVEHDGENAPGYPIMKTIVLKTPTILDSNIIWINACFFQNKFF